MKKPQVVFKSEAFWPIVLGLVAGCLEISVYLKNYFLFFLPLSTIFFYISAIKYGFRSGILSTGVALFISGLFLLIRPGYSQDIVPFLTDLGFTTFKFIIPLLAVYTINDNINPKSLDRVISVFGYTGLLFLIFFMLINHMTVGIDTLTSGIESFQKQLVSATNSQDKDMLFAAYMDLLQLIPGLTVFDIIKSQGFQFLIIFYFFYMRPRRVSFDSLFGFLEIEKVWLYIAIITLFIIFMPFSVVWKYVGLNIFLVVLTLFLFNGLDILYQKLQKLRVKKLSILFLLSFCYIFGWPLLPILCIGFIDRIYSLRSS